MMTPQQRQLESLWTLTNEYDRRRWDLEDELVNLFPAIQQAAVRKLVNEFAYQTRMAHSFLHKWADLKSELELR